jgi:hypothetical protein
MIYFVLFKITGTKWFYCEVVRYCYQYCLLYFSNFYDVNKKNENILTTLLRHYSFTCIRRTCDPRNR